MTTQPQWMKNLMDKHNRQVAAHEARFGKLGELMTKAQKAALKRELAQQKKGA